MGHMADAGRTQHKTIVQRITIAAGRYLLRPSSPFSPAISATPAFDPGIEILGLLIYTYEPQTEVENSALNSPNLRGEILAKKKGVSVCRAAAIIGD